MLKKRLGVAKVIGDTNMASTFYEVLIDSKSKAWIKGKRSKYSVDSI